MNNKSKVLADKWSKSEGATLKSSAEEELAASTRRNSTFDESNEISDPLTSSHDDVDQVQLGSELATLFKDNGVHPVFIFGSKGAGKTSLLTSLFKYFQLSANAEAAIYLFDDLFPSDDARWFQHVSWARDVFYKKVNDTIESAAPSATTEPSPFFVPIIIKRKTGEEIKIAFLEGKGEWYMPDETAAVPFKPFKGILQGLLQQFNDAATVIYVAPFTTGGQVRGSAPESSRSVDLRKSDRGLVGAINEYISLRKAHFHHDNHLLLITKWDIYCGGVAGELFVDPPGEYIEEVLNERFELTWTRFQALEISLRTQNKNYSIYCAGVMDGLSIMRPAQEDVDMIDRYPRKIWDWIHKNAVGTSLFEDVQPRKISILDRLIKIIRG